MRQIHTGPVTEQAFMAVDGSCHFIAWDAGAEAMLGYDRDEVLGRMPFEILLDHSEIQRVADFFVTMTSGQVDGEHLLRVYPINTRSGASMKGLWYHRQVMASDGSIAGIAVLITTNLQADHRAMWTSLARRTLQVERQIRARERLVTRWHAEIAKAVQPSRNPFPRLTQRELDIVAELKAGKRPKSIARDMDISPHTVRNHIKSIFRKLDVHSQEALISLFRTGADTAGASKPQPRAGRSLSSVE